MLDDVSGLVMTNCLFVELTDAQVGALLPLYDVVE